MASHLPPFLVAEVRSTFQNCARQSRQNPRRCFGIVHSKQLQNSLANRIPRARNSPTPDKPTSSPRRGDESSTGPAIESVNSSRSPRNYETSQELIPQERDGRAVGTGRTVDAPMKIIPKADITPKLRLSPKERLHIEILTRRPPPVVREVKPYKERLLIYHHGNLAENALVFLKVLGLVCAGTVTMIVVPAHYAAGTSLWLCGTILLAGWFPTILFHNLLKPLVTRIHLRLPPKARVTPDAAMKYAKNLPSSAQIDVSFTRMTALPGTVTVNIADLQPISAALRWPWQSANLQWTGHNVDKGSRFRPNPTEFSVKPHVGPGKAKRDVIPGIWPEVYGRLMGVTKAQVSKWERT